ncbi:MAG: ChaN family lipoprotein [Burkholderiales bacterium]
MKRLLILASLGACAIALAQTADKSPPPRACLAPSAWHTLSAGTPRAATAAAIIADMAKRDVVLLGEQHDEPDHHQWQLQTLASLHTLRPSMAIGFESFPRRVQPVLDAWVAGELSTRRFLERVEWEKVWSFPAELYLPLFQFARLNRIPMIALNVERTLTRAVGDKGWEVVPEAQKEGVSRPAPASGQYEDVLFEVFRQHAPPGQPNARFDRNDSAFRNFVESQLTWDRAMAEALASRVRKSGDTRPLVVGIMGGGHVRNGHGVPHQLRDLGVTSIGTLLPIDASTGCNGLKRELADAVFAVPTSTHDKPPPPRLGVRLENAKEGVRIASVTAGSLAETSGLQTGDHILTVAGAPAGVTTVIAAVRTQPAGTWLPLQIRRAQDTLDLVIKFPART